MGEASSALDSISTLTIEDFITHRKHCYAIVNDTHHMQQARHVRAVTALQINNTGRISTSPVEKATAYHISGCFG